MIDRVLQVEALLALDAGEDLATLHRRDRAIGRAIDRASGRRSADARDPQRRILEWARARAGEVESATGDARSFEGAATALLTVAGLVLGALAASGVLYYDGAGRVNVLLALALLVGLQGVTIAATLVIMLPARLRSALPGLGALQGLLGAFSPARLQRLVERRTPQPLRDDLARVLARTRAGERVYGRARRWLALLAGQVFAVAFNTGLLATYLAGVVFTDLAFGWSTTLDLQPSTVHDLTATLAAPWTGWLPDAVPTRALIDASRYFRAESAGVTDAAALGGWWPFVLMCILTYAALPRAILLGLAASRARAAIGWTLRHLPGAAELLYRLGNEPVESRAPEPEAAPGRSASEATAPRPPGVHGAATCIVWGDLDAGAAQSDLAGAAGVDPARTLRAGAGSIAEDSAVVEAAARAAAPVAIAVKSWEPPLGELIDFACELRAALGDTVPVTVVPLAAQAGATPQASDVATWRDRLALVGDPWLSVREVRP